MKVESINSRQRELLEADLSIKEQVRLKAMQEAISARFHAQLSQYGLTSSDNAVVRALAMASLQQNLTAQEFHQLLKSGWNNFRIDWAEMELQILRILKTTDI